MKCPTCHSEQNKVVDSRDRGNRIYRRRKCLKCNIPFTTYEISDEAFFRYIANLKELEVKR